MNVTTCIGCAKADDHPKHQVVTWDGSSHASVFWHMDCHRMADPPCEVCKSQTSGAEELKGAELREHLESLVPATEVTE